MCCDVERRSLLNKYANDITNAFLSAVEVDILMTSNRQYNMAEKCPTGHKAIARQPMKIFLSQRKEFSTILENFNKIFHWFKNYGFYNILYRISKLRRRNGQSLVGLMFNVRRR